MQNAEDAGWAIPQNMSGGEDPAWANSTQKSGHSYGDGPYTRSNWPYAQPTGSRVPRTNLPNRQPISSSNYPYSANGQQIPGQHPGDVPVHAHLAFRSTVSSSTEELFFPSGSYFNGQTSGNVEPSWQNSVMRNSQRASLQMPHPALMQRHGATGYVNNNPMPQPFGLGSGPLTQPTVTYPQTTLQNAGIGGYAMPFVPGVPPIENEQMLSDTSLHPDDVDYAMGSFNMARPSQDATSRYGQPAMPEVSNLQLPFDNGAAMNETGPFSLRDPAARECPMPPPPAFFRNDQMRANSGPPVFNQLDNTVNEPDMNRNRARLAKRRKRHVSESTATKQAAPSTKWHSDNMFTQENWSKGKGKQSEQASQKGDEPVFGPPEPSPAETLKAQKPSRNMTAGGTFVDNSHPKAVAKMMEHSDIVRAKRERKNAAAAKKRAGASSAPTRPTEDRSR